MTDHAEERHRATALWLVLAGLAASTVAAVQLDAQVALLVLALTLAGAAVARTIGRGRRPEGVAVRAWPLDVAVLTSLAAGISVLMFTPGV